MKAFIILSVFFMCCSPTAPKEYKYLITERGEVIATFENEKDRDISFDAIKEKDSYRYLIKEIEYK